MLEKSLSSSKEPMSTVWPKSEIAFCNIKWDFNIIQSTEVVKNLEVLSQLDKRVTNFDMTAMATY